MDIALSNVHVIARITPTGIEYLGTTFLVSDGMFATAAHVVGTNHQNLFIFITDKKSIEDYQNPEIQKVIPLKIESIQIDPFRDVAIAKTFDSYVSTHMLELDSLDNVKIYEDLTIVGYPHCTEGRHVLTLQNAKLGAKVLLESQSILSKHGVVNFQSRPGQSGSAVIHERTRKIVAILTGTYIPSGPSVSIAGINPSSLNQTTHILSAEYIMDML